jgi:hypothetical protein
MDDLHRIFDEICLMTRYIHFLALPQQETAKKMNQVFFETYSKIMMMITLTSPSE